MLSSQGKQQPSTQTFPSRSLDLARNFMTSPNGLQRERLLDNAKSKKRGTFSTNLGVDLALSPIKAFSGRHANRFPGPCGALRSPVRGRERLGTRLEEQSSFHGCTSVPFTIVTFSMLSD